MTSKSLAKNKGEWSEFYALLRILEAQKIPAADKDLSAIEDKYFVFKKIFRDKDLEFTWQDSDVIAQTSRGKILAVLKYDALRAGRKAVFEGIKNGSGKGAFTLPAADEMLAKLHCKAVAASSLSKSDIDAVIEDRVSNTEERLGFSVKSMLGGAATLLNASKDQTNFLYHVTGLDVADIAAINKIDGRAKIRDRLAEIETRGGNLLFDKMCSTQFSSNMRKIDTMLPEFFADIVLNFFSSPASKISDLVGLLAQNSAYAIRFQLTHDDYIFKIKQFLVASTLGMVPSKPWDGLTKAQGGYIIVKPTGEVVCYHLYNRDLFLSYLFENTKLETPSSSRHGFGTLFQDDCGEIMMKLNLQIRFIQRANA